MVAESRKAADGSTVVGIARAVADSLRAWVAASWLAGVWTTVTSTLGTATGDSALTRGVRTVERCVRNASLYRWLTKEPEPDVIVIDLRDTYAVGPVIALLDRLQPVAECVWLSSGLRRLAGGATAALRDAPVRTASIAAAAAVFANAALVALTGSLSTAGVLARGVAFGLALAGTQITTPWEELAKASTVRLLRAALEPPEPPEERDRE
jgi:hypothetical protein